jgi:class 3 adenylate cyclase
MACRFRPLDRNASAVLHTGKHLFLAREGINWIDRLIRPRGNVAARVEALAEPGGVLVWYGMSTWDEIAKEKRGALP